MSNNADNNTGGNGNGEKDGAAKGKGKGKVKEKEGNADARHGTGFSAAGPSEQSDAISQIVTLSNTILNANPEAEHPTFPPDEMMAATEAALSTLSISFIAHRSAHVRVTAQRDALQEALETEREGRAADAAKAKQEIDDLRAKLRARGKKHRVAKGKIAGLKKQLEQSREECQRVTTILKKGKAYFGALFDAVPDTPAKAGKSGKEKKGDDDETEEEDGEGDEDEDETDEDGDGEGDNGGDNDDEDDDDEDDEEDEVEV